MSHLILAVSEEDVKHTNLVSKFYPTFTDLWVDFMQPSLGKKEGSYFLRCDGTSRSSKASDLKEWADVLILDCDSSYDNNGEVLPLSEDPYKIHLVLKDMGLNHIVYSTFSNALNQPECRVLIECKYARGHLRALLRHVFENLEGYGLKLVNVPENAVWGQLWYFPRVSERNERFYKCYPYVKGNPLMVEDVIPHDSQSCYDVEIAPVKQRNDGGVCFSPIPYFNEANHPFDYLKKHGYVQVGDRLLRPDSESGIAGVTLCRNCKDGVLRVYSHGGDKLNDGYAHDSFDCYTIIEHGGNFNSALNAAGNMFAIGDDTLTYLNRLAKVKGVTAKDLDEELARGAA